VISVLTLFTVVAASRPVNKNVSTAVVTRAKPGIQSRAFMNYRTGEQSNRFRYKFRPTNGWYAIRFNRV